MLWFFLAIASALIFAAQELLMRVLAIRTGSPRIFAVLFNLWGALFAVILFLFERGSLSGLFGLTPMQYLLLASTVILYGFYERTQFYARQGVDASTFAIIFRLSTVIGFIGAIAFLGEPLTVAKGIGVVCIILASLLLVYKNPKFSFTRPFWYAIVCAVLLGLTAVLDKPASAPLPATLYSFAVWCFPIVIIAFPGLGKKELVREFHIGGLKVAFAALLNVIGYILYIRAMSLAEASRVNPITATSGIFTVAGGILLLHERSHVERKIIAAILAFIGVLLLK